MKSDLASRTKTKYLDCDAEKFAGFNIVQAKILHSLFDGDVSHVLETFPETSTAFTHNVFYKEMSNLIDSGLVVQKDDGSFSLVEEAFKEWGVFLEINPSNYTFIQFQILWILYEVDGWVKKGNLTTEVSGGFYDVQYALMDLTSMDCVHRKIDSKCAYYRFKSGSEEIVDWWRA